MAKFSYKGVEELEIQLGKIGPPIIKRIVMAGGAAEVARMKENIQNRQHIRTGEMMRETGMSDYIETLNGGSVEVYPLGTDSRGQRNATKAYVINYGIRGNRHPHSADHFITGDRMAERIVEEAMQKEKDRLVAENN